MRITIEGLTLGVIANLQAKGYKVEVEDGDLYANVTKEAPISSSEGFREADGYGGMG